MNRVSNKFFSLDSGIIEDIVNESTVVCYGHFNLIHPGHIRYLQHAKTLADKLIVGIISDDSLEGTASEHYYLENERAESVENLHIADYVIVLNDFSLDDLIKSLMPNMLVLGHEFKHDRYDQVASAVYQMAEHKGKVVYHAGEAHYYSTELLHGSVFEIEESKHKRFNKICEENQISLQSLEKCIDRFSSAELLIIGDTIVDHYVACDALGMSAEAPVLVVQELEMKEFIGGAAIVASHAAALGAKCHYISVIGDDEPGTLAYKGLKGNNVNADLILDSSRPTTYKTRYMVENQKLFRVSRLKDHKISKKIENEIIEKINQLAPSIGGILVSDFVYGLITDRMLRALRSVAEQYGIKLFGDSQSSSQVGSIEKFEGFHLITPTEKEARISASDQESGIEWVANKLMGDLSVDNLLMKLGSDGLIVYERINGVVKRQHLPALSVNPVDVTGAGDSLLAATAVSLSSGSSILEASVIGSCVASLAVQEVGNIPITAEMLDQQIRKLMLC